MLTTITIDPRAITYRIGSTLYIEAQAMPQDTPVPLRAILQDATNTDNLPLLNIHLSDAIARLQEQLLAYILTTDNGADTATVPSAGARGQAQPTQAQDQPVSAQDQPVSAQDQPVSAQDQPVSAQDQPQQAPSRPPRLDPVTIQLDIPGATPTTTATLQRLAAEYVTNYTLAAWLAITYPAKYDHYNQQAIQNQLDITATLTHRTQPIRRRPHPF